MTTHIFDRGMMDSFHPLRGLCPTSVWCDPPGIARFAVILLTPFLPRRLLSHLLCRMALAPLTILFRP